MPDHTSISIHSRWDSPKSETDLLGELADQELLIIDELGVESIGQGRSETAAWVLDRFYSIFDRAYGNYQTLIITRNKTLGEIGASYGYRIGHRIVSRIAGLTETWSDFPQEDLRLRSRDERG